jgi:hypothetical protein
MGQSALSSSNGKSNKKTKRIAKVDDGVVIRREFGELFESLHDRLIRVEKILGLLPSEEDVVERLEKLFGPTSTKDRAALRRSTNRVPYF